jgi:hypothetical protein
MSVDKTADNGTIFVFTKEGVKEPILIGVRDSHGRYKILLTQQCRQWQLQWSSKGQLAQSRVDVGKVGHDRGGHDHAVGT